MKWLTEDRAFWIAFGLWLVGIALGIWRFA